MRALNWDNWGNNIWRVSEMTAGLCSISHSALVQANQKEHWPLQRLRWLKWFLLNSWAIMAKIKLSNKPHSMVIFWMQLRTTYRLTNIISQAVPARESCVV